MFVSSAIDVVEGIVRVSLSVVMVLIDLEAAGVRFLQADNDFVVFVDNEVVFDEEVVLNEDDVFVVFVDEEVVAEEVVSDEEAVFDDVELCVELSVDSWDSDLLL